MKPNYTNHTTFKEKLLTFLNMSASELHLLIAIALTMAILFIYTVVQTEKLHEKQNELNNSISAFAMTDIETTETEEDIATAIA